MRAQQLSSRRTAGSLKTKVRMTIGWSAGTAEEKDTLGTTAEKTAVAVPIQNRTWFVMCAMARVDGIIRTPNYKESTCSTADTKRADKTP